MSMRCSVTLQGVQHNVISLSEGALVGPLFGLRMVMILQSFQIW